MPISSMPEISPFATTLLEAVVGGNVKKAQSSKWVGVEMADPHSTKLDGAEPPNLVKSVLNLLNGGSDHTIERLAFETSPDRNNVYASLYRSKMRLLPDHILKRIAIQDSLVAAIITARAAQLQSFGRVQPDRHSTGFKIEAKEGVLENMTSEQKEEFNRRVERAIKLLLTCGHTDNIKPDDHMTFAQFLGMTCRNAVTVGRIAVEVIWVQDAQGNRKVHSWRPIDAGTIYKAAPYKEAAQSVREEALHLLEQIKNKKLTPEKFVADEFSWVQVVEGRPIQAFTADECLVHNFFPVTDIELDGYPLTPIDTAIVDIATHINITTHNKMYFQTGRASKGMLVIKSDDINQLVVQNIKQQFNASINSVGNAWRMPVFGVGKEDDITWQPIDAGGGRDMEFQYLSDTNARVILSAFQMSPEELPGYAHLSRGTNNQALSESNNEYKMEAARDVGIRPLLSNFEDFVNFRLLPLVDENLSKIAVVKFVGLDAETPEKESTRIMQDAQVHLTYNEILQIVEKKLIDRKMGGDLPLNPVFQQNLDKYFTVGEVLEYFCGIPGASKDPMNQYKRDPFFFQWVELQAQQQQAEQAAAQGQPPPGSDGGGGDDGGGGQPEQGGGDQGGEGQPAPTEKQKSAQPEGADAAQPEQPGEDLARSLDQVVALLSKSEEGLPPSRRRLLIQHRQTVDHAIKQFEKDLLSMKDDILDVAGKFEP